MKTAITVIVTIVAIIAFMCAIIYGNKIYNDNSLEQSGIKVIRTIDDNNKIIEFEGKQYFYVRSSHIWTISCEYKK